MSLRDYATYDPTAKKPFGFIGPIDRRALASAELERERLTELARRMQTPDYYTPIR